MCLSPHQEHDKTLFLLEQLQRQKFELEQQKREFEEQQQKLKQAELQVCCGTPVSCKGFIKERNSCHTTVHAFLFCKVI